MKYAFGIYPAGMNLLVAVLALVGGRLFFEGNLLYEAILLACVAVGIAANVFAMLRFEIGPVAALALLAAQGVALILLFAGFYYAAGLAGAEGPTAVDRDTAIYFSVVTWTTLGYGDFAPSEAVRTLAAAQAILGLIFFGVFVGIVVHAINRRLSST